jgi:putative flippase GtrA
MKYSVILRGLIRRHKRRLSKSAMVSVVTTSVGFSLLWLLTTMFSAEGTSAALVNLGLSLPMTFFGFIVTWFFVWDDREITAKDGFGRWVAKALLLGGFSQIAFFVLVGLLGLEHMMIAAMLILVKMPFGYILNHEWVFKDAKTSEMA